MGLAWQILTDRQGSWVDEVLAGTFGWQQRLERWLEEVTVMGCKKGKGR